MRSAVDCFEGMTMAVKMTTNMTVAVIAFLPIKSAIDFYTHRNFSKTLGLGFRVQEPRPSQKLQISLLEGVSPSGTMLL